MTKKIIRSKVYQHSILLEDKVVNLIRYFEQIQTEALERGFTNISLDCEYGYDQDYEYYLYGDRLETDHEYEARLAIEKHLADSVEAKERKQYETLKKKYS